MEEGEEERCVDEPRAAAVDSRKARAAMSTACCEDMTSQRPSLAITMNDPKGVEEEEEPTSPFSSCRCTSGVAVM